MKLSKLFFILVPGAFCWAGNLTLPMQFESASVLPPKIRNFRMQTASTEISEKFTDGGAIDGLGYRLNRSISYSDLIDGLPAQDDRASLRGLVQSKNHSLDSSVGDTFGVVNARVTTTIPIFAYGVTEKWTLALAIPIVYTNVNVDTGWKSNEMFNQMYAGLTDDGRHNQKVEFQNKLDNVIKTKASNSGYDDVTGYNSTQLADAVVNSRYLLFKEDNQQWSLNQRLVLPTGRVDNLNRLVDIPTGDGQVDVGIGTSYDYLPSTSLQLGVSTYYLHQIAHTRAKRLPLKPYENLSPDIDYDTHQKLGDLMGASVSAKYYFVDTTSFAVQYSQQYKQKDVFTGNKFASERYEWMALDTEQNMRSVLAGVQFSTIPLFKRKQFAIPLDAQLSMGKSMGGRNVPVTEMYSLELAAYF
jgi:hypothetical protein